MLGGEALPAASHQQLQARPRPETPMMQLSLQWTGWKDTPTRTTSPIKAPYTHHQGLGGAGEWLRLFLRELASKELWSLLSR